MNLCKSIVFLSSMFLYSLQLMIFNLNRIVVASRFYSYNRERVENFRNSR